MPGPKLIAILDKAHATIADKCRQAHVKLTKPSGGGLNRPRLMSNQKPRIHFWKPGLTLCLDFGSGGWTRTNDLRVMSPTSCHCSTPRCMPAISDSPLSQRGPGGFLPAVCQENKKLSKVLGFEIHCVGQASRPVSTGMLKRLPSLHIRPIKQIVSLQSYSLT